MTKYARKDFAVTKMAGYGKMEASLSPDSGLWADYRFTGVREVRIGPERRSLIVKYHDDREEIVALPE